MKNLRRAFYSVFALFLAASAMALPLSLVSVHDGFQTPPAGGNGDSRAPILTPDGRYVLFASTANNLVSINGSNSLPVVGAQKFNVFQRDRTSGITLLISINLAGSGGGSGDSLPTAMSYDGRYALFESDATNLVSNDTNGFTDVFLRDVWSNATILVSITTNGFSGNGVSRGSTMTPDGRYIAFTSAATNLVVNDANGIADVFVRDMQIGVTRLASVGAKLASSYSAIGSESPEISADGRYVAFYTVATNLVPGVTNIGEIFIRDLVASTTTWASAGAHASLGKNAVSFNHVLSADGNFVAYEACTNYTSGYFGDVFRFNRTSGLTDTVCSNTYMPTASFEDFHDLNMTPDGRFMVFVANTNTIAATGIYLWDAQSGINTLVSGDLNGNIPPGSICDWPAVDPSGRFVAFSSNASGLVTNPVTSNFHLYLADMQAGVTSLVDADTNGVGVGVSVYTAPQLSTNGTLVVFEAPDSSLVADDRNHDADIFLHNFVAATNELISVHDPAFPSASPNGNTGLSALSSSADGRWLVFASEADNLVPGDTNGCRDVFVRDLKYGTNLLVSVGTNGVAADGVSSDPVISTGGGFVVFSSTADNLVKGDTNKMQDVFMRILPAGPTVLVSTNASGTGPGNNLSGSASISDNGRYVLFRSQANNLVAGSFSGTDNLFQRDMQTGTTYALTTTGLNSASMTPDGRLVVFSGATGPLYIWDSQAATRIQTNTFLTSVTNVSISPDGSKIAGFSGSSLVFMDRLAGTSGSLSTRYRLGSHAGMRFSADGRFLVFAAGVSATGSNQVYRFDFQTSRQTLISTAANSSLAANGISDSPDISADGRYIAYRSFATNLLATGDSNGVPDLFLYDAFTGATSLLTADYLSGEQPDNRSRTPAFSPDGRTLFFQSSASDLVPLDFNHNGDVLALMFLYVSIIPDVSGNGPTLTWPSRPGETYQVQFKDDLANPVWQQVNGSVSMDGNQASLTDLAPSNGQRFYRVVAF